MSYAPPASPPPPYWLTQSDPGACEILQSGNRTLLNDIDLNQFDPPIFMRGNWSNSVHCYMVDGSHPQVSDKLGDCESYYQRARARTARKPHISALCDGPARVNYRNTGDAFAESYILRCVCARSLPPGRPHVQLPHLRVGRDV